MNCQCYISKHLYGRVQNTDSNAISVPLNEQELNFLDFWKVQYKKDSNNKCNYIVDVNGLRNLFCKHWIYWWACIINERPFRMIIQRSFIFEYYTKNLLIYCFFIPCCRNLHIWKIICRLLNIALAYARLIAYAVFQNNILANSFLYK